MPRPFPAARFVGRRFFAFFALLAMFAQSVVAVAPLAEGRTARMMSHVESHGTPSHFTHDEANCVTCQSRSHYAVSRAASPTPVVEAHTAVLRTAFASVVVSADHSPQ